MKKEKILSDSHDKYTRLLLNIYRAVFKELGVDFDLHEKGDNWFMNYEMSHKRQEEIANSILDKTSYPRWRKNSIMTAYYLGCSPKGIKGEDY